MKLPVCLPGPLKIGILLVLVQLGFSPAFYSRCSGVPAMPCNLNWDASDCPSVAGYAVYYGVVDSGETNRMDVGAAESAVITNLVAGQPCFFFVVAYSPDGVESEPSDVLLYDAPALSPVQATAMEDGGMLLQFETSPGITCVIEATECLDPADWKPLQNVVADADGNVQFDDPPDVARASRFYRVSIPGD